MTSSKAEWIIRSSGRILGPYTKEEVEAQLRQKELVVFDEACAPCSRWNYIRDIVKFAKVVEDLRVRGIKQGEDDSQTATLGEYTFTGSMTESVTTRIDDLTEEISEFTPEPSEIVYEDVDESIDEIPNQPKNIGEASSYGVAASRGVQAQVQSSTRGLWILTSGIIVAVFLFVVVNQFISKPMKREADSSSYIQKGISALSVGANYEALEAFKAAKSNDPSNLNINFYLGHLLIQLEEQTVLGRRYLEEVIDGKYRKEALVGLGLADLFEGNLDNAESFFKKSLMMEPTYHTAQIDLGVVQLERREFARAATYFLDAIKNGTRDGVAYILYADSLIRQWRVNKNKGLLLKASEFLGQYRFQPRAYIQESLLMEMYINFLLGDREKLEAMLPQFLDTDPLLTENYRHSLLVDRRRVSWRSLSVFCRQIFDFLPMSNLARTMNAYCLARSGQTSRARLEIEDAILRDPKNHLIHSINAYILFEMGLGDQGGVALARATHGSARTYKLPQILQGRYCEEMGDVQCSKKAWEKVLRRDKQSVSAIAGLARSNMVSGNYQQAKMYLQKGLLVAPSYRPLLEVRAEAEERGVIPKGQPESL